MTFDTEKYCKLEIWTTATKAHQNGYHSIAGL